MTDGIKKLAEKLTLSNFLTTQQSKNKLFSAFAARKFGSSENLS